MNKQLKQYLEKVVHAVVEQDSNTAAAAFHEYTRLKSQAILMNEASDEDEEKDVDEDKEDEDKDADEDKEDEDKKGKKKDDCDM